MSGKLTYKAVLTAINSLANQVIGALHDDTRARVNAEKQLRSLTQALISEYGYQTVADEARPPQVNFNRNAVINDQTPAASEPSNLQPRAIRTTSLPQEIRRLIESTEMGSVEWVLTLLGGEPVDAKNAGNAFHTLFSVIFYTCILNPNIKYSAAFESLFKNDEDAAFNFLILQTADFNSLFNTENAPKSADFSKNLVFLERYLAERRATSSEAARENYRSLRWLWERRQPTGAEAVTDWPAFLRLATELIVESLDVVGKVVLLFKNASNQIKLKSLHIGPVERTPEIQVIIYLNNQELSVFGVVTPEDPWMRGNTSPGVTGKTAPTFEPRTQSKPESVNPRKRGDSMGPHQLGGLTGTEAKDNRNQSPTPRRVFAINNGPLGDVRLVRTVTDEADKTERTQVKYPNEHTEVTGRDSKAKIESESKVKNDLNGSKPPVRSYSVYNKKDSGTTNGAATVNRAILENQRNPPPRTSQNGGPAHQLITAKDLLGDFDAQKDLEKGGVGMAKLSRQNSHLDDTKNDHSEFFAFPDMPKEVPPQGLRSQRTSGNVPVMPQGLTQPAGAQVFPSNPPSELTSFPQFYNGNGLPATEKTDVPPFLGLNNASAAINPPPEVGGRPKPKLASFFTAFAPLLGQMNDYAAFVNGNTRAIQELYKPLPTSAPQVKRTTRDSLDFWKSHKGSFQERNGDENMVYERVYERPVDGTYLHGPPMAGGNLVMLPGGEGLLTQGNVIKVVRLNTNMMPSQRTEATLPDHDLKLAPGGLNFRRLGTQTSNNLDAADKK